jgi:hypothetical protein
MHPGWPDATGLRIALPGFQRLTRPLPRTPELGADAILRLASVRSARQLLRELRRYMPVTVRNEAARRSSGEIGLQPRRVRPDRMRTRHASGVGCPQRFPSSR